MKEFIDRSEMLRHSSLLARAVTHPSSGKDVRFTHASQTHIGCITDRPDEDR